MNASKLIEEHAYTMEKLKSEHQAEKEENA